MILTRLTITNIGVFRGRHEFALHPISADRTSRPVILFGGKNGAGKTTILEAIRLCLYGRGALGNRVRQTDYDTYIRQRMHRNSAQKMALSTASVGLLFDHVHAGVRSTYDAVRSWRAEDNGVQEAITITGEWDSFFVALLRERCAYDGIDGDTSMEEQFRAHVNRGVLLLYNRVKCLGDGHKLQELSLWDSQLITSS